MKCIFLQWEWWCRVPRPVVESGTAECWSSHASAAERDRDPTARVALMMVPGAGNDPSVWKCISSLLHHWLLVHGVFVVNVPASVSLADQPRGSPRPR